MADERFVDTPAYNAGWEAGYYGYMQADEDEAYLDGYRDGQMDAHDEQEAQRQADADQAAHDEWLLNSFDPVEQGFYDDDPNPYHGDYSEM